MNTNLFLLPGEAQAEMDMKLDAQKRELERKLISLGYAEIFAKAVRLPDAIVRSNPTFVNKLSSPEAEAHGRMMYFRGCFGAFAKHEFPLANILAAAKTATAYTSATAPGSVLIIPHGSPEMLQFTKKSSLEFNISGLKTTDHKPITMSIDNVAEDPSSGIKIMVHHPMPTYRAGSAVPSTGAGLLSENVTLILHYPSKAKKYANFKGGGWTNFPSSKTDTSQLLHGFNAAWTNINSRLEAITIGTNEDEIETRVRALASKTGAELMIAMSASLNTVGLALGASSSTDKSKKVIAAFDDLNPDNDYGTTLISESTMKHILEKKAPTDNNEKAQMFTALIMWLGYNTRGSSPQVGYYFFPKFAGAIQQALNITETHQNTIWQMVDMAVQGLLNASANYTAMMAAPTGNYNKFSTSARDTTLSDATHYRKLTLKMSSAILAAGGSDTGELLVGYPMTGVSTNARTESMTIALRVYLGAVLKRPENVVLIPHVAFEGIVYDEFVVPVVAGHEYENGERRVRIDGKDYISYEGSWRGDNDACHSNSGPLGHLDDPYYADLVQGLQIYKPSPTAVTHVGCKAC